MIQSGVPFSRTQNVVCNTPARGVGCPGKDASGGVEVVIADADARESTPDDGSNNVVFTGRSSLQTFFASVSTTFASATRMLATMSGARPLGGGMRLPHSRRENILFG